MDDPWGSPWAADDTQPKLDLPAPPPLAHTPQTPGRSPSPWGAGNDNDDDWGGWNTGTGGAESPGWGRSPGLRPARSGTVSRQPSPDAWARLTPLTTSRNSSEAQKTRQSIDSGVGDSGISLSEQMTLDLAAQQNHTEDKSRPDTPQFDGLGIVKTASHQTQTLTTHRSEEHDSQYSQSPVGSPARAISSVERPEPARQASKVQELVEMYDGIAQLKDAPAEPLVAGPRIALTGPKDDEEGSVGNSHQENENSGRDVLPQKVDAGRDCSPNAAVDAIAAAATNDEETQLDFSKASDTELRAPNSPSQFSNGDDLSTSPERHVAEHNGKHHQVLKVPSTPYSPDLGQLDALFPSISPSTVEPELVPDVIIDDTFASISERKAWYRISRRGPMRQHNSGNDEDYVRLDWRRAEVRHRTLLIVRRWMEEDSIAGRVVLGRRTGPAGASMFNWDSGAPQVQIAELLGRKSSHSRGTSITSRQSLASPVSPSISGPVAAFGWSSSPPAPEAALTPADDVAKRASSVLPQDLSAKNDAPALVPPPSIDAIVTKPVLGVPRAAVSENSIDTGEAHDDDGDLDDDWGEMVSSPTLPSHPTVETPINSSARGDPHEMHSKGQSLINPTRPSSNAAAGRLEGASDEPLELRASEASSIAKKHLVSFQIAESRSSTAEVVPDTARDIQASIPERAPGHAILHSNSAMHSHETTTEDTQAVVREILQGLPDLSYMLR